MNLVEVCFVRIRLIVLSERKSNLGVKNVWTILQLLVRDVAIKHVVPEFANLHGSGHQTPCEGHVSPHEQHLDEGFAILPFSREVGSGDLFVHEVNAAEWSVK